VGGLKVIDSSPSVISPPKVYSSLDTLVFEHPHLWYVRDQIRSSLSYYPILSYPILSYPILSYPILSYPILSYPILSYPILSYPGRNSSVPTSGAYSVSSYNWSSTGVPAVPVVPFQESGILDLYGPTHMSEPSIVESEELGISCRTMATYPQGNTSSSSLNSPYLGSMGAACLCDAFRVRRTGNRLIFVLCDGCSWGPRPREAAQTAAKVRRPIRS
jgi:hypothetical protein